MTSQTVVFDLRHHTVDAVQRAAYAFSDRLVVDITQTEASLVCEVTFLDSESTGSLDDFKVEVLDQTLRERVRAETADVRNLILALAYSNVVGSEDQVE